MHRFHFSHKARLRCADFAARCIEGLIFVALVPFILLGAMLPERRKLARSANRMADAASVPAKARS